MHIQKSIVELRKIINKDNKSIKLLNASKRSTIVKHLVNNFFCASRYNLKRLKIINDAIKVFDFN